jgi:hypothetical protein
MIDLAYQMRLNDMADTARKSAPNPISLLTGKITGNFRILAFGRRPQGARTAAPQPLCFAEGDPFNSIFSPNLVPEGVAAAF